MAERIWGAAGVREGVVERRHLGDFGAATMEFRSTTFLPKTFKGGEDDAYRLGIYRNFVTDLISPSAS